MSDFLNNMSYFIDIEELKAVVIIIVSVAISYVVAKILLYFADRHFERVIEPTFEKYRRGEQLTKKEAQIVEKYRVK